MFKLVLGLDYHIMFETGLCFELAKETFFIYLKTEIEEHVHLFKSGARVSKRNPLRHKFVMM